ncbi:dihydropteroate synthase [bacterium]|jgi:dihydropteroate synthase|nr:dihydropteroate synthase [bacterium]MBT6831653.1 dihydropteroate synthase [bacterium]MBT6996299.1 dihydropteroate synthase [bacterium]MBT7772977.1 dihydropteroate synthase [bacterium]
MKNVKIFGILNVTPDSFSDGGKFLDPFVALQHARNLLEENVDFLDVGGESTRPDADTISPDQEWARIFPILDQLFKIIPENLSLDTFHPETAEKFLALGGTILNDVSGFQNPKMRDLVAKFQPLCIVNHFPGKNSADAHEQEICSKNQVVDELLFRKSELIAAGVSAEKIVLDPGIGFGKTMDLNRELLKFSSFVPNERVMIGHSRKRFLGENRFEIQPNLAAAKIAIESGTEFLRVHDVSVHKKLAQELAKK